MPEKVSGVLKNLKNGVCELRDPARSFRPGPNPVRVPTRLVKSYRLEEGAYITGPAHKNKKGIELVEVETVCGVSPEEFKNRRPYTELVAIDPCERFNLGASGNISMRIVDLLAPIGKGTRGLIVSPPKAGKTIILEQMANAIRHTEPDTRIIVLLIDERPEEVTHFRRAVDAEVMASANDQSVDEHVELVEMAMAHIRTELECGRDVVVLVDSLTRMGRAFNLRGRNSGRTMSGGVTAGALEIPRRFFGLARNIEFGGSVTIIATALIDTGSRMDQLIFEEFKGTGNSEIILNRKLAEAHIFPAIDAAASGTRKEALLYSPEDSKRLTMTRRVLSEHMPREAMTLLIELMKKYPSNEAFLESIPTKV